jgi:hypothetical protein
MRLVGPLFIRSYEHGWDRGLVELQRMMEAGSSSQIGRSSVAARPPRRRT